jgi:hypothetical protein
MAILGGLYTASVALMQRIFVALTGNPSDAAIVVSTLLLAGALTPLRRWLEAIVERNTRARAAATVPAPAPQPDTGHEAILARLAQLERQLAEMAEHEPQAAASDLGARSMDALRLPAAGEGGLPAPILSAPDPSAVTLAGPSPGPGSGAAATSGTARIRPEPATRPGRTRSRLRRLSEDPGRG